MVFPPIMTCRRSCGSPGAQRGRAPGGLPGLSGRGSGTGRVAPTWIHGDGAPKSLWGGQVHVVARWFVCWKIPSQALEGLDSNVWQPGRWLIGRRLKLQLKHRVMWRTLVTLTAVLKN